MGHCRRSGRNTRADRRSAQLIAPPYLLPEMETRPKVSGRVPVAGITPAQPILIVPVPIRMTEITAAISSTIAATASLPVKVGAPEACSRCAYQ